MSRIATILMTTLIGIAMVGTPAAADTGGKPISIAAGDLEKALQALVRATGAQLLYEQKQVEGVRTRGVEDAKSAAAAVAALLEGTTLKSRVDASGAIFIVAVRDGSRSSAVNPADQMRVAVNAEGKDEEGAGKSSERKEADGQQITVQDRRIKPWTDANADTPRTVNDAQPYYIFDAKTIDQSGATNVEDFLKQRLTMNTVAQTNAERSGLSREGSTSSIDLRGVGADKTLILVNGRRMAGVNHQTTEYQPDLNGIPLSAIERVEVMPSSASGIYGGSAMGGVVNVILKRDYSGGEVRVNYDNTIDGGSAGRSLSASYGLALESGRTHMSLNASWSDKEPLLLRDRLWIFQENLAAIQSRDPDAIYSSANPWLGSLPNIIPGSSSATTLTLKPEYGGTVLNSRNTHVPANTSPGTSTTELADLLLANAGQWNLDFPLSTQSPTGLLRPFGQTPKTQSLRASLRRQMRPWLELAADFSWHENRSDGIFQPTTSLTVRGGPAGAPTNPFTTDVRVRVSDATRIPVTTRSLSRRATLSAIAQLPWNWTGALDYSWSENRFGYLYYGVDVSAQMADLLSGELNPLVDTLQYPLNFQKYLQSILYQGANRLHNVVLRGSGPLPALPWGQPMLTVGLERRIARTPERTIDYAYPISVSNNRIQRFYARDATTDSGYMEATVPLVKAGWLTGLHGLELQLSGRNERYQVDTGTPFEQIMYERSPPRISYGTPNLNNQEPVFSEASYSSSNYTVGLKYQPIPEVTLRVSRATAFLPPRPEQLLKNPLHDRNPTLVDDPQTGQQGVAVHTLSGGNPDLTPQNSKSLNAGIIWLPTWKPLEGLRLNVEYFRIEQFDAIGTLDAQVIVDQESMYPGRVTRDDTGTITLVDASLANLYRRETEGWDLSLDYAVTTRAGRFSLRAAQSIIVHLKNQYDQALPEFDAVNFPSEGGATKYKTNATLNWESGPLMLGWTARYFSSYKQYGAAGGPDAARRATAGLPPSTTRTLWQGGDAIPSQIYHDLFVAYSFDHSPGSGVGAVSRLLDGLSMQLGVRNVFDKVAPLDAFYSNNYYMSPYGDVRLRSYWLNARLSF